MMQKLPEVTKRGKHLDPTELTALDPNINLCVITHLD